MAKNSKKKSTQIWFTKFFARFADGFCYCAGQRFIAALSHTVQGSVFSRIDPLLGGFRVGDGVHDSYTFPVRTGGIFYFSGPGIDISCIHTNKQ